MLFSLLIVASQEAGALVQQLGLGHERPTPFNAPQQAFTFQPGKGLAECGPADAQRSGQFGLAG